MVSSKYYVYGDGRWRQLDAATGRVSGWRGARLCVARRGRLEVRRGAARRRLLAALRALAAGRPSAVRLGPRLARKPLQHDKTPSRSRTRCHCCCHRNNNRCEGQCSPAPTAGRSQRSLTSDACIQTAPPPQPRRPHLAFPPSTTTVATVHQPAVRASPTARNTSTPITRGPTKRRNSSTSWNHDSESASDSTEPLINKVKPSPTKKANLSQKRKRSDSESLQTSKDEVGVSQSILKKDFNAKYLRPRMSRRTEGPTRIKTRVIPGRVVSIISSDNGNKDPTVSSTESAVNTQETETEEEKMKHKKSVDLFTQISRKEYLNIYRELVISEEDIDVLRTFMLRTDPHFDVYRYDIDNDYKARFFYSINPLVSLQRCPRILRMLERREEFSLRQFASQLGLRSVSDTSDRPPPRKRRRANVVYSQDDTGSEDKENVETTVRRSLRRHDTSKPKDKSDSDGRRTLEDRHKRGDGEKAHDISKMTEVTVNVERLRDSGQRKGNLRRTSEGSQDDVHKRDNHSDKLKRNNSQSIDDVDVSKERQRRERKLQEHQTSNTEGERKQVTVPNNVAVKNAPVVSKVGIDVWRSKEYSQLEDCAIVSWISVGDRASLVNGNRVWRALETVYEGVTGRARSWHSLRNRYLRYLLPALGRLELPRDQQARLRAAAALGEIKGKHRVERRNSIYGEPARGAASRKPGLRPSPRKPSPVAASRETDASKEFDSSEPSPPRPGPRTRTGRTPRYSDVTRQFAARHRARASSSEEFEPPKSPTKSIVKTRPKSPSPSVNSPRLRPRTPATPQPPPPAPGPRSRTRKLYNPNKL